MRGAAGIEWWLVNLCGDEAEERQSTGVEEVMVALAVVGGEKVTHY